MFSIFHIHYYQTFVTVFTCTESIKLFIVPCDPFIFITPKFRSSQVRYYNHFIAVHSHQCTAWDTPPNTRHVMRDTLKSTDSQSSGNFPSSLQHNPAFFLLFFSSSNKETAKLKIINIIVVSNIKAYFKVIIELIMKWVIN